MIVKRRYISNDETMIIDLLERSRYIVYSLTSDNLNVKSIHYVDGINKSDCLLTLNGNHIGISAYYKGTYVEHEEMDKLLIKCEKKLTCFTRPVTLYKCVSNNINVLMSMWLGNTYNICDYFLPNKKGNNFNLRGSYKEYPITYENYRTEVLKWLIKKSD